MRFDRRAHCHNHLKISKNPSLGSYKITCSQQNTSIEPKERWNERVIFQNVNMTAGYKKEMRSNGRSFMTNTQWVNWISLTNLFDSDNLQKYHNVIEKLRLLYNAIKVRRKWPRDSCFFYPLFTLIYILFPFENSRKQVLRSKKVNCRVYSHAQNYSVLHTLTHPKNKFAMS